MSHSREDRDQRLALRLTTPLYVTIGEERVLADDWSLGGCGVTLARRHAKGSSLVVRLGFPLPAGEVVLDGRALVTFSGGDGRHGLSFSQFAPDALELVRKMWQGAALGEPLPLDMPPQAPRQDPPPPPSPLRLVVRLVLMACGGTALVGLSAMAYSTVLIVGAGHAAVTVPVVTVRSPADGYFTGPPLVPGMTVPRGTPLFDLAGPEVLAGLELADAELSNRGATVTAQRQRRLALREFFADYVALADAERDRAEAERGGAAAALALANTQYERLERLAATGHAALARLDQARTQWLERESKLFAAEAAVQSAKANQRMARQGRWFTGSRVEGIEPAKLDEEIRQAEAAFDLQARTVAALIERREALVVTSPCDGVVVQAPVRSGEWLRAGTVVYLLRPHGEPAHLTAKVAQDDVDLLAVGDHAAIRLAGRSQVEQAEILDITREPPADPRFGLAAGLAQDAGWATVTLALPPGLAEPTAGMPAQVRFPCRRAGGCCTGWDGNRRPVTNSPWGGAGRRSCWPT